MMLKQTMKAIRVGAITTAAGLAMVSASQAANASKVTQVTTETPAVTIAQAVDSNSRYLSITGQGRAFAPADKGAIIFAFRKDSNYAYSEDAPEGYDRDAPIRPDDLDAIKRTLTAAGVSENDISLAKDASGVFGEIDLMVRMDMPTRDRVNAIVDSVVATDEVEKSVELSSIQTYYSARDCEATEIEARRIAIADAQKQSTTLAAIGNVTIGDISSISSHSNWGYISILSTTCPDDLEAVLRYAGEYSQTYDRMDIPEIPFDISISVSYFIK